MFYVVDKLIWFKYAVDDERPTLNEDDVAVIVEL